MTSMQEGFKKIGQDYLLLAKKFIEDERVKKIIKETQDATENIRNNLKNTGKKGLEIVAEKFVDTILKPSLNDQELITVLNFVDVFNINVWKGLCIALVTQSGLLIGLTGGAGLILIFIELIWCGKVAGIGCMGVGHILAKNIDPDDIKLILMIWAGAATPSDSVSSGQVAIAAREKEISCTDAAGKITIAEGSKFGVKAGTLAAKASSKPIAKGGGKMMVKAASKGIGKVTGKLGGKLILKKGVLKGGTKLATKIVSLGATLASSKILTKLTAKIGPLMIPIIGCGACIAVNIWLLSGILNSAEKFYRHNYVVLTDKIVEDLDLLDKYGNVIDDHIIDYLIDEDWDNML